jgi:hypothetical protein
VQTRKQASKRSTEQADRQRGQKASAGSAKMQSFDDYDNANVDDPYSASDGEQWDAAAEPKVSAICVP